MEGVVKLASIDNLPLFAADCDLGPAILGPKRAGDWPQIAALLESKGLPTINAAMGGRYTPAVKAFFDRQYGLAGEAPQKPDGVEDLGSWRKRKRQG